MNEQSIQKQYNQIVSLLEDKRLKEALVQLDAFLYNSNDWTLRNRLEQIQTSYQYMLQYMKLGMKDPERHKLYRQLLADTWEIADQTRILLLDEISTHYYHSLRRNPNQLPKAYDLSAQQRILEGFSDEMAVSQLANYQGLDAILKRHEETHQVMFLTTWSNNNWTLEEFAQAEDMLRSETLPINDLCLFVSAVTLSLMECFDERKINWLLDGLRHTHPQINQRALVGLVITLHLYPTRITLYPELEARISLFREDPDFSKQVNRVYIQLLRSQETEKIDKKMREEIIPEMMRNPRIGNANKIGFDETEDSDDLNPEWENWIDKSGITDKLREMGELQMEGADVYMSTFSQLKQFPFFRQMSHWFYPFDRQFPDIVTIFGDNEEKRMSLLDIILNSDSFCNSDKYSFCFSLIQMPESQRELMIHQMNEQSSVSQEQLEQITKMTKSTLKKENISRQYIHDLYRFFKLWSRRSEEKDIFESRFELWKYNSLKKAITQPEELKKLADYFFQKDYMEEAFQLYSILLEENKTNSELWQKAGYSLQKLGNYDKALSYYKQADIIAPDALWTNRHLALCYHKLGMPEQALQYFKKVKIVQPDNLNLSLQIGQCLVALKRYEEALGYFFKVEYLEKNPNNARRAIGWCSFVIGKYEEARKYYDLLLQATKPKMQDWMNAGHLYYTLGNIETAINYYQKAQSMCEDRNMFLTFYLEDKKYLIEKGFSEEDIYILLDELL